MKVFNVKEDYQFQCLNTEERSQLSQLVGKLNKPLGNITLPIFYVSRPKALVGNFYELGYGMLAYDDVAGDALSREVAVAGEHYLVEVEGVGTLNVLKAIETCDALDHEKTVWREEEDGGRYIILEHVFKPERIATNSGLFRIAENRFSKLLAVTGAPSQQGDFYRQYHEAGLTGLEFIELWSDEGK